MRGMDGTGQVLHQFLILVVGVQQKYELNLQQKFEQKYPQLHIYPSNTPITHLLFPFISQIIQFPKISLNLGIKIQTKQGIWLPLLDLQVNGGIMDKIQQVHIGHYILGKTIGNGGFAKVKQARHDLTGIRVAIKILNKRKMKNRNMISKVKREIKILRFISHPNIIKLYQVLDTTNDIFVIMELAQRGELFDYLQTNQICQDQARFLFRQIINGLDYAHSNFISHRDLKPQNILIDSNKIIKIVDFGLSNLMKDGKLLKTACGSPNYAAPQIVSEKKYEGTSVDVWSCGVILYTLIVGHLPFYQQTLTLLYKKIQTGNYKIPNNINPLAADLIERMLQVDPFKRIRIHQIKSHPWIRPYIPIYSRIPLVYQTQKPHRRSIDKSIFQQIKQYTYSQPINKPESKMRKSIKKRSDDSFVVAYELLKDTKEQNEKVNKLLQSLTSNNESNSILSQIQNIVVEKPTRFSDFQYGRRFLCSIKSIVHSVLQTFKYFGIEYTVKHKEYCLKCIFFPNLQQKLHRGNEIKKSSMSEEVEQDHERIQTIEKYSRKQIIFYTQFYMVDANGKEHIIDLQLTQGHPLIFLNLSSKLYKMIGSQSVH